MPTFLMQWYQNCCLQVFCVLVWISTKLQTAVIKRCEDVKRPVLVIEASAWRLLFQPSVCVKRARLEEWPASTDTEKELIMLHRGPLAGFSLVVVDLEHCGHRTRTVIKCKDTKVEQIIPALLSSLRSDSWPMSEFRPLTMTTLSLDRSKLIEAACHGLHKIRSDVSLQHEKYEKGLVRRKGFPDNKDGPIIAVRLNGRQEYQLALHFH